MFNFLPKAEKKAATRVRKRKIHDIPQSGNSERVDEAPQTRNATKRKREEDGETGSPPKRAKNKQERKSVAKGGKKQADVPVTVGNFNKA